MDPVISVDTNGKVPVFKVRAILSDEETKDCMATFLTKDHFPVVLTSDADVYTEDGQLLLRFRKQVLSEHKIDEAYEAMKEFIKRKTTDRGVASGSEQGLGTGQKTAVMSNILGYFDKWGISQKATFKRSGVKYPGPCRLTSFNVQYPNQFERIVPLIQEIDKQYERLCPKEYADQRKAAKQTPFHITNTAFSTVTTNLNFRTAAHKDSGDWPTGFGNLVVIERGAPYKGSFTGFPQYGVAVDCRQGDFLAMDVHQVHGNSPFEPQNETSQRISLVSYLREGIIRKCKGQKMYNAQKLEETFARWRKTQKVKRN
jgi:hypothetical protein